MPWKKITYYIQFANQYRITFFPSDWLKINRRRAKNAARLSLPVFAMRRLMFLADFFSLTRRTKLRVSQGFWGTRKHWQNIEGNKGTLANFWEQGNKTGKIAVRNHSERVWEHGNIGQFWNGTREQGPPPGRPYKLGKRDYS